MRTYRTPGFTLIELIVVIVILGILAAVAVPKFVNFRDDAEKAAIEGFVASLKTAHTVALGKLILCNEYPHKIWPQWPHGKSYVYLWNFLQYSEDEPSPEQSCAGFCGLFGDPPSGDTQGGGNTIGLAGFRPGVFADPTALTDGNWNPPGYAFSLNNLRFTTKTGRDVQITQDLDSGAISWTASPAY